MSRSQGGISQNETSGGGRRSDIRARIIYLLLLDSLLLLLRHSHVVENLGDGTTATQKVGMVGVDVGKLHRDQVADHLASRNLALVQELVDDVNHTLAENHESLKLARLHVADDALQLIKHKLDAIKARALETRDLLASQQLESSLGHKECRARTLRELRSTSE